MHHERGVYHCDHCGDRFPRANLCGRKPHYCSRTCRQRSYESRRRLLLRVGRPVTDLVPVQPMSRRPPRYESASSRGRGHLLRTEGMPDRRRFRPTLCGTYARPLPANANPNTLPACRTCAGVARRHPPMHFHHPATDVAVLRSLVARLRHPDEDISSLVDQLLGYCFSP